MKTELKALHRKDPKLAAEVAKVLGYSIKTKAANQAALKKVALGPLNDASKIILKVMDTLDSQLQRGLPNNIEKLGLKTLAVLKAFAKSLQTL